jgi:hypothetical protein
MTSATLSTVFVACRMIEYVENSAAFSSMRRSPKGTKAKDDANRSKATRRTHSVMSRDSNRAKDTSGENSQKRAKPVPATAEAKRAVVPAKRARLSASLRS